MTEQDLIDKLAEHATLVHKITKFIATSEIDVREPRDWDNFLMHVIDLVGATIKAKADAEAYKRLFTDDQ